ncbi:unnamed protein product [Adineta steineri]|uniref:Uncharacterized protein n=1 Tax=Adineta steineri TaxID=433720 RepID=A0A813VGG3_9BILA|nr:unnamed protein product [Adineta steineri]CAF0944048.1 unnamed protein product [Adineta steineri]
MAMAMENNKSLCLTCNEDKITFPCKGCSNEFCLTHLTEHQNKLHDQLNHIINDYDQFKERINEQKQNPQNHSLIKQINQWERNSIEIIKQKAKDCREVLIESLQTCSNDIEKKFNDLSAHIRQIQKENEFNEINLNYLKNQLIKVTKELNNPSSISIHQNWQPFINEISIILSKKSKLNKWSQSAITVAGRNGERQKLNQLDRPFGIFIDKKKNTFIADRWNHRIVEWKCNAKKGQIVAGGSGNGNRIDQLSHPIDVLVDQQNHSIIIADYGNKRVIQWLNKKQLILIDNTDCCGLAMDTHGFLYVSDLVKNEVRRWKMGEYNEGTVVAGGNGQGNQLNQLNRPTFIFVDEEQSVYVSDVGNHRVMKWRKDAKEGTIVAGGNGKGGNLNQLSSPEGVIVDDLGQIYVADFKNNRVMCWCEGKEEGEIAVGGNGGGNQSNQFYGPIGLSFDDDGNLYVSDRWNHRIEKFEITL